MLLRFQPLRWTTDPSFVPSSRHGIFSSVPTTSLGLGPFGFFQQVFPSIIEDFFLYTFNLNPLNKDLTEKILLSGSHSFPFSVCV